MSLLTDVINAKADSPAYNQLYFPVYGITKLWPRAAA